VGWWGDSVPEETLSREEAKGVLRRLFGMLRPQRPLLILATIVIALQAGALLAGPALVRHGIDSGLLSNGGKGDAGALNLSVVLYLGVALAGWALGVAAIILVAKAGEAFLRDLRNRVFGHMMSLSLDYFEREKTGRVVARMTSDIDAMQELIAQGLVLFVMNVFIFVGAVIAVLLLSWQLALGLYERFAAFPEGLDTEVRERGSRLSAGERQLVSLARAALADPTVLILDEATSNLDPGTEHTVEAALDRHTEGRTVVVVAHRLSTAARADRIAVVYDGRLAELGTHDELVAHEGHYAALYRAWITHQAHPDVA
jgi:ABC-type multidrug transport system fused ATPase/permease subunit